MTKKKLFAAGLFGLLFASVAYSSVSLRNGNFFVGYVDIVYPGGFDPKIERIYNSKTPFNGMFGWGWGFEYEAHLTALPDGSVVIHEYGGGAENRFRPKAGNQQDLVRAVDQIAGAAQKAGVVGNASQLAKYKKQLTDDSEFRYREWVRFRLPQKQFPAGTQLISNRFSYQYLTRVADGYVRTYDSGKVEKFRDPDGKLVKVSDRNNNSITLSYTSEGKLEKLVDNFNRKIFFYFNGQGKIVKIAGENGKEATYEYNKNGELVKSKDTSGNTYTYGYSTDNRHNLVSIGNSNGTSMTMTYYPRDKNENIKSVKDTDGTLTEYGFETDTADKNKKIVNVKIKGADGKPISSSHYEYFMRRKADGEEWTYKLVSVLDGDRTETVYNECCGMPIEIKKDGETTAFSYDIKGRVTKKITPEDITELKYNDSVGKVARVSKYPKKNPKKFQWSQFEYDNKGNLLFANNSEGKGVKLFYDPNGRIKTLVDQNKRQIQFKYNENSKPVQITDPALGSINVTYNNSGEIKEVQSPAGRKIAMQVTSAFQNLLDIIRPAGVTLSF